jgi:hypothetical protein
MKNTPAPGALRRLADKVLYAGCSSTEIDRRNVRNINLISFAWAISYCTATYFLKADIQLAQMISMALIGLPMLLGAAMLWSYLTFLRGCDEMMRKLHLEALALGFGITVLAAILAALLEAAGFEPLSPNTFVAIAAFSYMFGVMLGWRRYR